MSEGRSTADGRVNTVLSRLNTSMSRHDTIRQFVSCNPVADEPNLGEIMRHPQDMHDLTPRRLFADPWGYC